MIWRMNYSRVVATASFLKFISFMVAEETKIEHSPEHKHLSIPSVLPKQERRDSEVEVLQMFHGCQCSKDVNGFG